MVKMGMTAIEMFAGIGGFRLAADEVGLDTVWANDINPKSCSVYKARFAKNILVERDIKELMHEIPPHDVLTAGFPCQPFSSAGKKEGVRDPRGTLFESIVEVLKRHRPRFFVLENVKRLLSMEQGEHFATVLSALTELDYFIEWRLLNAKDFGLAQNRERVVIVGARVDVGLHESDDVTRFISLASQKDIESQSSKKFKGFEKVKNWSLLSRHGAKFPCWGISYKGLFFSVDLCLFSNAQENVFLKDVLEKFPSVEYDLTEATMHRLADNEIVQRYFNGVEIISNQAGGARMGYTIFGVGGIAPTLTASTSRHYERYYINGRYRRLTPVEYARLQGFPDDHCSVVKPYDQYSLFGNAAPPPMIKWVFERLLFDRDLKSVLTHQFQQDLFYV